MNELKEIRLKGAGLLKINNDLFSYEALVDKEGVNLKRITNEDKSRLCTEILNRLYLKDLGLRSTDIKRDNNHIYMKVPDEFKGIIGERLYFEHLRPIMTPHIYGLPEETEHPYKYHDTKVEIQYFLYIIPEENIFKLLEYYVGKLRSVKDIEEELVTGTFGSISEKEKN